MFETIPAAAPDPILGLQATFKADPRQNKVNLAIGVYCDAQGRTLSLKAVVEAEKRLLEKHPGHGYLPIEGLAEYGAVVREMLFGAGNPLISDGRAVTAQCPGGTGALRVAADLLGTHRKGATVWISDPTWPNHFGIFQGAGLTTKTYRYFDAASNSLNLAAMLEDLKALKAGDAVLLHGCCHNPTGVDPTPAQWKQIAEAVKAAGALPIVDFAYQGFGDGLEQDAAGLRVILGICPEVIVCSSFSKNFGLYGERAGAMTLVAQSKEIADTTLTQIRMAVRTNYSNPPAHGARVVAMVLGNPELKAMWEAELKQMCGRIAGVRKNLRQALDQRGVKLHKDGNAFIETQKGMFTMSGLSKAHVERLQKEHGIFIVGSGRINVAGITDAVLTPVADAIAAVVK